MSLSDIKGTALGTKMGVVNTVKKVTVVSPQPKSGIIATAATNNLNSTIGQAAIGLLGFPGVAAIIYQQVEPMLKQSIPNSTKTVSINPTLSPTQQAAVDVSRNQRMTSWLNANPMVSSKITALRTAAQVSSLNKQGLAIIPRTALDESQNYIASQSLAMEALTKQNQTQQSALSDYYSRLTDAMQQLQAGTQQGAIYKEQLQYVTNAYNQLKNNPTNPTPTGSTDTGTNWGNIAIIGIVAIAAVILLGSFIKRK